VLFIPFTVEKYMQSSILSFRVEEVQEEWYIDFNCTRKKKTKNQKEKRKNDATGIPVCCLFFKKKVFSPYYVSLVCTCR
jgi:hypothetical protein